MENYKITMENGDLVYTRMNATLEEARAHYIGESFNFGDTDSHPADLMVKAVAVDYITPRSET